MQVRYQNYNIVRVVLALVFLTIRTVSASFKWNLESKLIVFGENVELSCNGNACEPKTVKKWIGGPNYKLLCFDGYSSDYSKYEIMFKDTTADFGLMIKNFDVNDTYCSYTCACGIHQTTHELELEGIDFIYPPVIKNNNSIQGEGKYKVAVQMTVYPLPVCYITYQENVSKVDMMNSTTTNAYAEHRLRLYNVFINHTVEMDDYTCNGTLFIKCYFGKRNYTLINKNINMCKDHSDTNDTTIKGNHVVLVVIIIPCLLLLVVVLWWNRVEHHKLCEMSCLDKKSYLKCIWMKPARNNNEPMPEVVNLF